ANSSTRRQQGRGNVQKRPSCCRQARILGVASELDVVQEEPAASQTAKIGKTTNKRLYGPIRRDINPPHERMPWHSGQITTETARSGTGRHAREAMRKSAR